MTDEEIEAEIQAKGLAAPRVTLDAINAAIFSEHYFTAQHGVEGAIANGALHQSYPEYDTLTESPAPAASSALGRLTFCVLVMKNGFTVIGHSACVSQENFDEALGRKIARQHAVDQCWSLFGFHLACITSGWTLE